MGWGNVHNHLNEWKKLDLEVEGVNNEHYFRKFKGNFKRQNYDCATPSPEIYFPNSTSCRILGEFISSAILEKLKGRMTPKNICLQLLSL